jgi:hypothetical protein
MESAILDGPRIGRVFSPYAARRTRAVIEAGPDLAAEVTHMFEGLPHIEDETYLGCFSEHLPDHRLRHRVDATRRDGQRARV